MLGHKIYQMMSKGAICVMHSYVAVICSFLFATSVYKQDELLTSLPYCSCTNLIFYLQDLVMYKKFREKEVASAARSLITLFRDLAPGMLEKKDRGRDADLTAGPQAFGARVPMLRVQGADLLQQAELRGDVDSDEEADNMWVSLLYSNVLICETLCRRNLALEWWSDILPYTWVPHLCKRHPAVSRPLLKNKFLSEAP